VLFYLQMRWNIEGRATLDDVFTLQEGESSSVENLEGLVAMYKVAAQRRVIAIVDFPSADDLDRLFMSKLPLREYLELEAVWPLRPFEDFVADCISWSRPAAEEPR
jgi:muconolactone D-isomerase